MRLNSKVNFKPRRVKMRFLQIVLLLSIVVGANAGKITWDKDGKPIMEKTDKPIRGCNQGGLETLGQDSNSSNKSPCMKH